MDTKSSADLLAFFSGWASIISFFIALISLYLIKSVRASVKSYKRRARIRQIVADVERIPLDAIPLSQNSKSKLISLKRNIPAGIFAVFTQRGRVVRQLHKNIDSENLVGVRDDIADWVSHSEVDL